MVFVQIQFLDWVYQFLEWVYQVVLNRLTLLRSSSSLEK